MSGDRDKPTVLNKSSIAETLSGFGSLASHEAIHIKCEFSSLNYFHCLIFFFVVICSFGRCASHAAFELKLSIPYTFYWHQCNFFS